MLLERDYRVRILDSFIYGDASLSEVRDHPNLEIIQGDICDRSDLRRAVKGVESVVALAALVGDPACELYPDRTMAVNYQSTCDTLDACKEAGVDRLVFASSCSVYGANGDKFLHEGSFKNPVSLYARTRIMSEDYLLKQKDVDVVILRLSTVCGVSPRMRFDLMVNTMTANAVAEGVVRVQGADQWRPHVHVQDAAEAFIAAIETPEARNGIFNVGTQEENYTIGEVAEKVAAHVPGAVVEYGNSISDKRSYRVSFDRILNTIGFRGRRTIDDAIAEVYSLMMSGAVRDFRDSLFNNAKWLSNNHHWRGAA
jgi:nucleoside-diphosphate-sugar epimerase